MCLFSKKKYAKMSVLLVKTLKIRGGWGLCPCQILCAPLDKPIKFCSLRNFGLAAPLMTPFAIVVD